MDLNERIKSLANWGRLIESIPNNKLNYLLEKVRHKNGWFTIENCTYSLREISKWLTVESLKSWTDSYNISKEVRSKTVGLVMAGNIPLVGFHDLLSVLISGHNAKIKMSSQDDELLPFLVNLLSDENNKWRTAISFEDRLKEIDAVIATGSDNSSRYFEHYFKSIPRIIRKNRTSIAVIMGEENTVEYKLLANDIFMYFGLGCRNVSKLYIPKNFELNTLFNPFQSFQSIIDHNKYANNYDYQRAIRLISSKPFIDLGFLLLEESEDLVSPISVVYYQQYEDQNQLNKLLISHQEKIQCISSAKGWFKGSVPFGKAQQPALSDYADNVDTLDFLLSI